MKLLIVLLCVFTLSGCSVIDTCNKNPGACSGGSEYIKVDNKVYRVEKLDL